LISVAFYKGRGVQTRKQ